jgi:tetratricopeptide (TPR) repeat protein
MRVWPSTAARAFAVLVAAAGPQVAHAKFTSEDWMELVRRYARGDRADVVRALGAWSERDLVRQIARVERAARSAERCPACPNELEGFPLRAAVLLHWDLDRADQGSPGGVEQPRRCPGFAAGLAGRLNRLASRNPETSGFARRFLRMVVLSCQWDACFADAERWANDAVLTFPLAAELLLTRGSVREEVATLGWPSPTVVAGTIASADGIDASWRRETLDKARRDFADTLAIDPGHGLARVRLGRVLWRLGELEPARRQLETALLSPGPADRVYLAHLFLGRIHQDAGRLGEALSEYRLAVALHPSALSAGTALSNALFVAGDADGARQALRQGLRSGGRRTERDPLWDYLLLNAADLAELTDTLHREPLE